MELAKDKANKYNYKVQTDKDTEMRLDDPLLDRHSTHPSSTTSPRGFPSPSISAAPDSNTDIMAMNMKMGLFSYEEVIRDRNLLKRESIEERKLVSEREYHYLEDLTLHLPGHFTTQMLFSIALIKSRSVFLSLSSVFFYYLPSLVLTIIISQLDVYYRELYAQTVFSPKQGFYLYYLATGIIGVSQAVLGLLIFNTWILFKQEASDLFNILMMLISAILTLKTDNFTWILVILLVWGALTIIRGQEHHFEERPTELAYLQSKDVPFLGKIPFSIFAILFGFSFIVTEMTNIHRESYVYLMSSFYQIGSLTTTGGHSIIPLVLSKFESQLGRMEILKGFGFVSLLPGPMFNLAAFIGGVANGIIASLVSVIAIALPGLLLVMSILPYTKYNTALRNFLIGLTLASIGFNFAACFKLYSEVVFHNPYVDPVFSTINIIICFLLFYSYSMSIPIVLILGGAIIMFYSLIRTQVFV